MAAGQPLSRLALAAGSVADDVGYIALADLSRIMGEDVADYRIIGGHTVTVLRSRHPPGSDGHKLPKVAFAGPEREPMAPPKVSGSSKICSN